MKADIWASNEEVEYERHVHQVDLEEGVKLENPNKWFYRDLHGVVQGPFATEQMVQWQQKGVSFHRVHRCDMGSKAHSSPWDLPPGANPRNT